MTSLVARLVATAAVALAAAGGASGLTAGDRQGRVVVVADPAAARAALGAARGARADVRLPRSPTEQLSVTHLFAARGYTLVGVGLDERIAVRPVAARYPHVRIVLLPAGASRGAVRAAIARAA
jgi:hypothetical protein